MKTTLRMRTVRTLVAGVTAATMLLSAAAGAGNRSGTVTGQFLKLSTSARAIAMGGAQVGVAEGVN